MNKFKLTLTNAFNELQCLESNSIDCLITDSPFGITQADWDFKWDEEKFSMLWWPEVWRVIKPKGACVMFASGRFKYELESWAEWESPSGEMVRYFCYEYIWVKNKTTNHLNAKKMPQTKHETVMVFTDDGKLPYYNPVMSQGHNPQNYAMNDKGTDSLVGSSKGSEGRTGATDRYPTTVLEFNVVNQSDKVHPTQKPTGLMEFLIKTFSPENGTVLDPFMGSGSTGVACGRTNRNFIGFELNRDFFNIAEGRISISYDNTWVNPNSKQMGLFK